MVWEDLKPSDIVSPESLDNAITTVLSLSGSTNAVIHLIAMAKRAGIDLKIDRFDELSSKVPVLEIPSNPFIKESRKCWLKINTI